MKIQEKLDVIRKEVMAYVWSDIGEELEAAKSLETIFSTLQEIADDFEHLSKQEEHWLSEYMKLRR